MLEAQVDERCSPTAEDASSNLAEHTHGPVDYWLGWRPLTAQDRDRYPAGSRRPIGLLGKDAGLSRRRTGFNSPMGHHAPSKWNAASATNAGSSVRIRMGRDAGGASAQLRFISEAPWG